jgi:hypothetical protein
MPAEQLQAAAYKFTDCATPHKVNGAIAHKEGCAEFTPASTEPLFTQAVVDCTSCHSYSHTPILMRGPLNTSLPLLSTCSRQLGSSMMADWGQGRYMAAAWSRQQGSAQQAHTRAGMQRTRSMEGQEYCKQDRARGFTAGTPLGQVSLLLWMLERCDEPKPVVPTQQHPAVRGVLMIQSSIKAISAHHC